MTTVGLSTGWHLFSMPTAEVKFFCDDRAAIKPAMKASSGALSGVARQSGRDNRAHFDGTAKIARPFD